jgi:hypothetical protein
VAWLVGGPVVLLELWAMWWCVGLGCAKCRAKRQSLQRVVFGVESDLERFIRKGGY